MSMYQNADFVRLCIKLMKLLKSDSPKLQHVTAYVGRLSIVKIHPNVYFNWKYHFLHLTPVMEYFDHTIGTFKGINTCLLYLSHKNCVFELDKILKTILTKSTYLCHLLEDTRVNRNTTIGVV